MKNKSNKKSNKKETTLQLANRFSQALEDALKPFASNKRITGFVIGFEVDEKASRISIGRKPTSTAALIKRLSHQWYDVSFKNPAPRSEEER